MLLSVLSAKLAQINPGRVPRTPIRIDLLLQLIVLHLQLHDLLPHLIELSLFSYGLLLILYDHIKELLYLLLGAGDLSIVLINYGLYACLVGVLQTAFEVLLSCESGPAAFELGGQLFFIL